MTFPVIESCSWALKRDFQPFFQTNKNHWINFYKIKCLIKYASCLKITNFVKAVIEFAVTCICKTLAFGFAPTELMFNSPWEKRDLNGTVHTVMNTSVIPHFGGTKIVFMIHGNIVGRMIFMIALMCMRVRLCVINQCFMCICSKMRTKCGFKSLNRKVKMSNIGYSKSMYSHKPC